MLCLLSRNLFLVGYVVGNGPAYALVPQGKPQVLQKHVPLTWYNITVHRLMVHFSFYLLLFLFCFFFVFLWVPSYFQNN